MTAQADGISYREEGVPLEGMESTASEVVELYGGRVTSREPGALRFQLPRRRGADSSGSVACVLEWGEGETGTVTLSAEHEIDASRPQRIALLVAGTLGALVFTVWPFFPAMGNVAGVGLVVAVAVYLLTLRQSPHGLVGNLLRQIVHLQDEQSDVGTSASEQG